MKKVIAGLMGLMMIIASVMLMPNSVKAVATETATPIQKISFIFDVQNVSESTSATYQITSGSWEGASQTKTIAANGEYTFTFDLSWGANSMINMGYFTQVTGSPITATLKSIVVNGIYTMNYYETNKVLKLGSDWENGLCNIWSTIDDKTVVANSADSNFKFMNPETGDSSIVFNVVTPEPTTTAVPTTTVAPTDVPAETTTHPAETTTEAPTTSPDIDLETYDLTENTMVSKSVFENAKGKDKILEFVLNDGSVWSINGNDITGDSFSDMDLGVLFDTSNVPDSLLEGLDNDGYVLMSLSHNGSFGFTGYLSAYLGEEYAGQTVKLYYYNEDTAKLELMEKDVVVDEDGYGTFTFTHASDYVISFDKSTSSETTTVDSTEDVAGGDSHSRVGSYVYILLSAGVFMVLYSSTIFMKKRNVEK